MKRRRDTLASIVAKEITQRITDGEYKVGEKIPVEARLCEIHEVSRTVVREAIAQLRNEGLLVSRHGIGVFVTGRDTLSFRIDRDRAGELSEILEILEMRLGIEVEAAGLAALRHDAVGLARIEEILERTSDLDVFERNAREVDFEFHRAIAVATGNGYLPRFMDFIGPVIIPRSHLIHASVPKITREYLARMLEEHRRIGDAIRRRNVPGAQEAMRDHLTGSLERYRKLRENVDEPPLRYDIC